MSTDVVTSVTLARGSGISGGDDFGSASLPERALWLFANAEFAGFAFMVQAPNRNKAAAMLK